MAARPRRWTNEQRFFSACISRTPTVRQPVQRPGLSLTTRVPAFVGAWIGREGRQTETLDSMTGEQSAGEDFRRGPIGTLANPALFLVLRIIGERGEASAKDISTETGKSPAAVGRLIATLQDRSLIKVSRTEQTRGTRERFYEATEATKWVPSADFGRAPVAMQRQMLFNIARCGFEDVAAAINSRRITIPADWCFGSIRSMVDRQGWRELVEVHEAALEAAERIRRESRDRLQAPSSTPAIRASSTLFLVELDT